MSTCALVGSATFNTAHFKSNVFDCVIAVDGGYASLQAIDVEPDWVIGDFDSLGYVPERSQVLLFSAQKDESDMELALQFAVEKGYDELTLYGTLGGRLDFTYATTQLIVRFAQEGKRIVAVDETEAVCALVGSAHEASASSNASSTTACGSISFPKTAQGTISLFAVSSQVCGVDEVGLEYPLSKASLTNDKPLGVSNAFVGNPATVAIEQGTALIFFPANMSACVFG